MEDKHLIDDGAVIGYQPNLQYKKQIDIKQEQLTNSNTKKDNITDSSLELHSNTFVYLLNNMPFKVLENINNSKNTLTDLIKDLSEKFPNKSYSKYSDINALLTAIETNNQDYIDSFVNYHSNDIKNSIIPEIINTIYESYKRLDTLNDTFKLLYYGSKNISIEDAKESDTISASKIASMENNNEQDKINYVCMNYDSTLNRIISLYTTGISKDCIELSSILDINNDFNIDDSTDINFINKIYNQINNSIELRNANFNSYQNIEILPKSLYNYYNIRQDLINFYNLSNQNSSVFLGNKIIEYQDKLDNSIEEITKVFLGNRKHVQLLKELEEEKQAIVDAYDSKVSSLNK